MDDKTLGTVKSTCYSETVKMLLATHKNLRRRRTTLTHCFYDSLQLNVEEMSAAVTAVIQCLGLQVNQKKKEKKKKLQPEKPQQSQHEWLGWVPCRTPFEKPLF